MKTKLWLVSLILFSLISLAFVSADVGNCNMAGMMYGSYGLGLGIFSWLFGLLILIALILFIVWLIKQIQKK